MASTVQLERLTGPAATPPSDSDIARRAVELSLACARNFLDLIQHKLYERGAANQVLPPISAGANGGLVTQASMIGHYELADDEALIVTAARNDARYMGFQLADMWMVSYDYDRHSSCLNHCETQPDADGLIRYVISPRDPGVWNWLDGSGHHRGTMTLRWQGIPAGTKVDERWVSGQVVKLADLRRVLPASTRFVTEQERSQQQAVRAQGYARRFSD